MRPFWALDLLEVPLVGRHLLIVLSIRKLSD